MLLRFQKPAVRGNYETGNQAVSMHLRFLTTREGQLLSQEQNFRAQGCARVEQETEQQKYVPGQISDQVKQRIQ